ncbi:exodeoxyribonuclease VII small subunit [Pannonibacter sp. Q-1]|uniref:Exodeoxyribonuclease 7 small subunit n=3 Tax=Pannonibacter TaxID=227873 RepID=A0A0L0J2T0_9HYPH|nr:MULTISPECIES: exodeoxyribonuclease VII small subunit [Pannonibacter]ALV25762.1 exodeoxyribonuclease VII small subunit [Pannonibacter phragmitetus]KND19918.1 exodeoxyribonuclease VII small subunit [Pannonibacter phragmitetus]CUA95099.1 Exodeoxyribonuclease VII small subunit [Pannonibacter indicus]SUB00001.1 Exodeoxyribonuclease 7 small subunit [Pannonibacter phragmitetus]
MANGTLSHDEAAALAALSFEEALSQLESIVRALEQGNVPLEKSIEMYERGDRLRARCDQLLKAAEEKVEKIQLGADGRAAKTVPLDPEA